MPTPSRTRAAIIREAFSYQGLPWMFHGSDPTEGFDSLGLVRSIMREVFDLDPPTALEASPDWGTRSKDPSALEAFCCNYLTETDNPRPGDVLLFRMVPGGQLKTGGIMVTPKSMIIAYWGRAVTHTKLAPWWTDRLAASFRFPARQPQTQRTKAHASDQL